MPEPLIDRPHMPGYGVSSSNEGALPWDWAEERLRKCRNYFVATTRPDARPHLMPVWGAWVHDQFVFSTAITSVKSKNLLQDPSITITIDDGHESVIVEGEARLVKFAEVPDFVDAYKDKYDYQLEDKMEPVWAVRPRVAFGFIEDDSFTKTSTRWRFEL
ncbi:MAG: pyridoxamine 5'-phosphate oxidase family protein [Actinomycetota bacterium]